MHFLQSSGYLMLNPPGCFALPCHTPDSRFLLLPRLRSRRRSRPVVDDSWSRKAPPPPFPGPRGQRISLGREQWGSPPPGHSCLLHYLIWMVYFSSEEELWFGESWLFETTSGGCCSLKILLKFPHCRHCSICVCFDLFLTKFLGFLFTSSFDLDVKCFTNLKCFWLQQHPLWTHPSILLLKCIFF